MIRNIRFFLLGTVFVAACKVGPDYERPLVPEQEGYRNVVPADTTAVLPADSIADLADTDVNRLRQILEEADPRLLRLADPTTWPEQAGLAAEGQLEALQALQDELKGGTRA